MYLRLALIVSAIGLFMGFGLMGDVAGAVFMLLGLLVHDVYQLFITDRPMAVFDRVTDRS